MTDLNGTDSKQMFTWLWRGHWKCRPLLSGHAADFNSDQSEDELTAPAGNTRNYGKGITAAAKNSLDLSRRTTLDRRPEKSTVINFNRIPSATDNSCDVTSTASSPASVADSGECGSCSSYCCTLCNKFYTKYTTYDNHINSYDHAHRQRLKDLEQREHCRQRQSTARCRQKSSSKQLRRVIAFANERLQTQSRESDSSTYVPENLFQTDGSDSTPSASSRAIGIDADNPSDTEDCIRQHDGVKSIFSETEQRINSSHPMSSRRRRRRRLRVKTEPTTTFSDDELTFIQQETRTTSMTETPDSLTSANSSHGLNDLHSIRSSTNAKPENASASRPPLTTRDDADGLSIASKRRKANHYRPRQHADTGRHASDDETTASAALGNGLSVTWIKSEPPPTCDDTAMCPYRYTRTMPQISFCDNRYRTGNHSHNSCQQQQRSSAAGGGEVGFADGRQSKTDETAPSTTSKADDLSLHGLHTLQRACAVSKLEDEVSAIVEERDFWANPQQQHSGDRFADVEIKLETPEITETFADSATTAGQFSDDCSLTLTSSCDDCVVRCDRLGNKSPDRGPMNVDDAVSKETTTTVLPALLTLPRSTSYCNVQSTTSQSATSAAPSKSATGIRQSHVEDQSLSLINVSKPPINLTRAPFIRAFNQAAATLEPAMRRLPSNVSTLAGSISATCSRKISVNSVQVCRLVPGTGPAQNLVRWHLVIPPSALTVSNYQNSNLAADLAPTVVNCTESASNSRVLYEHTLTGSSRRAQCMGTVPSQAAAVRVLQILRGVQTLPFKMVPPITCLL